MKLENEDYELIANTQDPDLWSVRFKTGLFNETVITYGSIAIDEEDEQITFNFEIDYSPDPDLTNDIVELQEEAAKTLFSIITNSYSQEDNASKS